MRKILLLASLLLPSVTFAQAVAPPFTMTGTLAGGICLKLFGAHQWCPTGTNTSKVTTTTGTTLWTWDASGNLSHSSTSGYIVTSTRAATGSSLAAFRVDTVNAISQGYLFELMNQGVSYWRINSSGNISGASSWQLNSGVEVISSTGSPESSRTAALGSVFMRSDGNALTSLYAKGAGAGNTGWGAITIPRSGGTADTVGTATLVGGTVTVSTTVVAAGTRIFVSANTPGGVSGILSAPIASIVAGTSFVINSSSAADTSTVNWSLSN